LDAQAYVLHQLVQFARGQHPGAQINVIGHSFGSFMAIREAGVYHDIDRLVATGALHGLGPAAATGSTSFYPAQLDPQFSPLLDPGYLTTVPGARQSLFYSASADPAVIADDEAHKDILSSTEFSLGLTDFLTPGGLNIAAQVTVPVLGMAGELDALICGLTLDCTNAAAVQANEEAYYLAAPSVSTVVVANTGHDLNLHPSISSSFATINQWLQTH
jgi:pimeloyl-ACP methyl ester carboxylesterase